MTASGRRWLPAAETSYARVHGCRHGSVSVLNRVGNEGRRPSPSASAELNYQDNDDDEDGTRDDRFERE